MSLEQGYNNSFDQHASESCARSTPSPGTVIVVTTSTRLSTRGGRRRWYRALQHLDVGLNDFDIFFQVHKTLVHPVDTLCQVAESIPQLRHIRRHLIELLRVRTAP